MIDQPFPMLRRRFSRHLSRRLTKLARMTSVRRFSKEEAGVAAVEFVIVMGLFLVPLWLGFTEVALLQRKSTQLNTTTAMVADMISQYQAVTPQLLSDIMETGTHLMGEGALARNGGTDSEVELLVMGVVIPRNQGGNTKPPRVAWSMSNNGNTSCALARPLPAGIATPAVTDRFLIVVEGEWNYEPLLTFNLDGGPRQLQHRSIFAPRVSAAPPGPNACPVT